MKKFNTIIVAAISVFSFQISQAQLCTGIKGPNLLGAKGTFSAPFITVNPHASPCLTSGSNTYNPNGNVGNALTGCSATIGSIMPCSDYNYTAATNGMTPEFTYSIIKIMGDASGSNCLHSPIWKAKDHTNDGGYFMAVNGAPSTGYSTLFYQIKTIPVCVGTTYEFSAWVINMMPAKAGIDNAAPNVSFVVNGLVIGTSGPIPYDSQWHKVGGSFTATTTTVDLQVINATLVAGGNDLGLDDISINVCASRIEVSGTTINVDGSAPAPQFVVTDALEQNTFYKWQLSTDGGVTFSNITSGASTTYDANHTFTVSPAEYIGTVTSAMNGYIYRLVVATSKAGLINPDCIYFNDYKLVVVAAGPMPVQLTSFAGTYSNGVASLKWQTSQEFNSDRFELFRSADGSNFTLAKSVGAAGNSSTIKNYQYQDQVSANAGSYVFYKLKQIDKDGKFAFSSVIKLSLGDAHATFQLFPNPVVNNFTASFTATKTATATLIIRNTTGQAVYSTIVNVIKGNNSIVVSNAPLIRGMYYVSVVNDEINYTGKLQKQ
jgi:hypothetical protein